MTQEYTVKSLDLFAYSQQVISWDKSVTSVNQHFELAPNMKGFLYVFLVFLLFLVVLHVNFELIRSL